MAFFKGQYESKLDSKGRMVLPSRLKAKMPEKDDGQLVVQQATKEKCLFLYASSAFDEKLEKVSQLNEYKGENRKLQRKLMSRSADTDLDGNGRFLIPKWMLEWAGMNKEVVVIGVLDRIELWSPEHYKAHMDEEGDEDLDRLAEEKLGVDKDEL